MKRLKPEFLIVAIFFLAAFVRFWRLDTVPPSVNWDEASIGYNAYSIALTGRDEFGQRLPLVFRSLNDYKPPLYIYTDSIAVRLFGLNAFSVRFPAAFFGTLTVLVTFYFVKKLTRCSTLALVSSLFLALSPWHIQFSRSAVESGFALFFIVSASYFFLLGLSRKLFFIFSGIFFGLSIYAYQSPRVFTPLLIILLLVWQRKFIVKQKKWTVVFLTTFLIFFLPLTIYLKAPQNQARFRGVSVFDNPDPFDPVANLRDRYLNKISEDRNSIIDRGLHNRRLAMFLILARGYFAHFNINYLFLPGGSQTYATPQVGQMYLIELPMFLSGFYFLARRRIAGWPLIVGWILLAPVVAAPTIQIPNSVRSENMLPMIEVVSAIGAIGILKNIKNKKIFMLSSYLISACLALNVFFYLHQYHVHMPQEKSKDWQYGWRELVDFTRQHPEFDKVVIYPQIQTILDKSHVFLLFYTQYDPRTYLAEGGTKMCDFGMPGHYNIGRYELRTVGCTRGNKISIFDNIPVNSLLVSPPPEADKESFGGVGLKVFRYLDGTPSMIIYNSDEIIAARKR